MSAQLGGLYWHTVNLHGQAAAWQCLFNLPAEPEAMRALSSPLKVNESTSNTLSSIFCMHFLPPTSQLTHSTVLSSEALHLVRER